VAESFDDKRFCKFYMRLFKKIYDYDKIKYLPPRFDTALRELAAFFFTHKEEFLLGGCSSSIGGGNTSSSIDLSFSNYSQVSY